MKKLFIGCRVRILYSNNWPELDGTEGRITDKSQGGRSGTSEWVVTPDLWGSEWAPNPTAAGGKRFGPHSDQLEPILPDSNDAGTMTYEELMTSLRTQTQEEPA